MSINPYQSPAPEPEEPAAAKPASSFPPFGIGPAAGGVLLFGAMVALEHFQQFPWTQSRHWLDLFLGCVGAAVWAAQAVVALMLLGLITSRRTAQGFLAGHWLCLVSALPLICYRLPLPVVDLYNVPHTGGIKLEVIMASALAAAVFAPAFLVRSLPLTWRIYFLGAFVVHAVHLLLMLQGSWGRGVWFNHGGGAVISTLVLAALFLVGFVVEIVRRRRADWGHWVGVLSPAAGGLSKIAAITILSLSQAG